MDVSLLESLLPHVRLSRVHLSPHREGARPPRQPPSEPGPLRDLRGRGRPVIVLAVGSEGLWRSFCASMGEPELADDPRFRTNALRVVQLRRAARAAGRRAFARATVDEWLADWEAAGIPCGRVRTVAEALDLPQVAARGLLVDVEHPVAGRGQIRGQPHPSERCRRGPAAALRPRSASTRTRCSPSGSASDRAKSPRCARRASSDRLTSSVQWTDPSVAGGRRARLRSPPALPGRRDGLLSARGLSLCPT